MARRLRILVGTGPLAELEQVHPRDSSRARERQLLTSGIQRLGEIGIDLEHAYNLTRLRHWPLSTPRGRGVSRRPQAGYRTRTADCSERASRMSMAVTTPTNAIAEMLV